MLHAYQRMEALGVIGKMMKVDAQGNEVFDMTGEIPGNLVVRPFREYPKIVRRFRTETISVIGVDGQPTLREVQRPFETLVHSKNEELRLLAETPSEDLVPKSPLEQERDALAAENIQQSKTIESMQEQMLKMQDMMSALASKIEQSTAERVALGGKDPEGVKAEAAKTGALGKGIEALATGKK